ncbi:hypothetical protein LTR94_033796, partial [Friedmanniomyces endolithicus]
HAPGATGSGRCDHLAIRPRTFGRRPRTPGSDDPGSRGALCPGAGCGRAIRRRPASRPGLERSRPCGGFFAAGCDWADREVVRGAWSRDGQGAAGQGGRAGNPGEPLCAGGLDQAFRAEARRSHGTGDRDLSTVGERPRPGQRSS